MGTTEFDPVALRVLRKLFLINALNASTCTAITTVMSTEGVQRIPDHVVRQIMTFLRSPDTTAYGVRLFLERATGGPVPNNSELHRVINQIHSNVAGFLASDVPL